MNKMGKAEECAAYFKGRPVYRKVFQKVRAKYELPGAEEAMEAAEAFKTAAEQAETETGEPAADAPELV